MATRCPSKSEDSPERLRARATAACAHAAVLYDDTRRLGVVYYHLLSRLRPQTHKPRESKF